MNRPFTILEGWVRDGRLKLAPSTSPADEETNLAEDLPGDLSEEELFEHAMRDVKSLGWSAVPLDVRPPVEIQIRDDEQDALRALEEFVSGGKVQVEQTPEYIERSVQPIGRLYLSDLRSGRFAVQAHLDLHGLGILDARGQFEKFIRDCLWQAYGCVRIVHGRGQHSADGHPLLKEHVQRWLCSRRMSRHIVAYTSARLRDGGGGALYVLLKRKTP